MAMEQTGCKNVKHIREVFGWNNNDLEKTVVYLWMEHDEWGSDCWYDQYDRTTNELMIENENANKNKNNDSEWKP